MVEWWKREWLRVGLGPALLNALCVLMQMLTKERAVYFGGFGVLNGMLAANYLHAVHFYVGPQVIPAAFFASVAIFFCFSAAALVAKQRQALHTTSFLFGLRF